MFIIITQHTRRAFVIFIMMHFLCATAFSAVKKWDGGGGDNLWSNALNWDSDVLPNEALDDITIDCSCTVSYDLEEDLIIGGSLTLASATTLYMGSEKLIIDNSMIIAPGATVDMSANNLTIGSIHNQNATLTNNGTIIGVGTISHKGKEMIPFGVLIQQEPE